MKRQRYSLLLLVAGACLTTWSCTGLGEPPCEQTIKFDTTTCSADSPDTIYWLDNCGEVSDIKEECAEGKICGEEFGSTKCVTDPEAGCIPSGSTRRACNPDDPDAIYEFDSCDVLIGKSEDCDDGEYCAPLGNIVQCKRDLNDCRFKPDYKSCNPDDTTSVYLYDGCGELIEKHKECGEAEVCEQLGNIAQCSRDYDDCRNKPDYKDCNPDDPIAVYLYDGCGEVIEKSKECEDAEICELLGTIVQCGADPEDCRNQPKRSGCDPADLSAVYRVDGCGDVVEELRSCASDELCFSDTAGGECIKDCGTPQSTTRCDSSDETALFWADACGDITGVAMVCDTTNFEVCDDSSGTAQCVRDCGSSYSQKVCVDGDIDNVYNANECGEVTTRARPCLQVYDQVCSELVPGDARCAEGCGDPQTGQKCNPLDRTAVYWTDRCGVVTTKKEQCDTTNFEQCKTIGGQAQCVRSCGSDFAQRVCNPADPTGRYYANECGELGSKFWTCDAANFEVCDDSSGTAKCVQDCGTDQMAEQVCNPADPSAVYWADQCGNPTQLKQACQGIEECDDSSGTPTCSPNCGGSTRDHKECSPTDPTKIIWANRCGAEVGTAQTCRASNFEVCDDSSGTPTCTRECGSDTDGFACDPANPGAIYYTNACGEVTTKFSDCDATNFERCDDSTGAPVCQRDCGSIYDQRVCDPGDPSAIYYANACGEVTRRLRTCQTSNFEVCDDSSGSPTCARDCGDAASEQVCNQQDPSAIYYANECGDVTTKVMDCPAMHQCDDSGATPVCTLDCGSSYEQKVCIPGDLDKVYYANACGQITGPAQSCLAIYNKVCDESIQGQASCVDGCGNPETSTRCDASDPGSIYWADRCGVVTTRKEQCDASNFEQCKMVGDQAQCVRSCGSDFAQRVCNPADPTGRYYANECGELGSKFWTCDAANFEVCDDSSGTAKCVQDCGTDQMAEQVCNPADPSAVYWADQCGNPTQLKQACQGIEECDDSSGTPTCSPNCGGSTRDHKECSPTDPTKIIWANRCGAEVGTAQTCRASNFEVCDDSSGTPTCTRECGSDTDGFACDPANPGAIYYTNACGEVTTKLSDCDAANFEVCDDSTGSAKCVRDCGSDYTQKVCDPNDPSAIYYANACGEITRRHRSCSSSNFEVCDDSSGVAACVQDCGDAMSQQVCNPTDSSAVYWADQCGNPTTKVMDCPAMHQCDDSGALTECTLDCGSDRERKVCDPANPGRVYWANACGAPTSVSQVCNASNFEVCDDSTGAATCQRECGASTAARACDASDPSAVYWSNECGEITSKALDCDASNFEVCDDSSGDAVCARDCGTTRDAKICDPNDPSAVYWANECGEITDKFTDCNNGKQCTQGAQGAACGCVATEEVACFGTNRLYSPSGVTSVDSCGLSSGPVVESCLHGEICHEVEGQPTCWSTVRDKTSPFYIRGCTMNLYKNGVTDLYMDCRCRRATSGGSGQDLADGIPQCWPIEFAWNNGHRFANGPHFYPVSLNRQAGGGVLDAATQKIYFAFNWSDSTYTEAGAILAFDYITGERSIVSGLFKDPSTGYATTGMGHVSDRYNSNGGVLGTQTLPYVQDVKMGADGYLYAFGSDTSTNVELTKVDKATGARTLVWKREVPGIAPTHGQCYGPRVDPSYSTGVSPVQYGRRAFAMDPQGNFYLSFNNSFDGMGIVKISANGQTCTILSRNASTTPADAPDIGGGYAPQYSTLRGMLWHNNKIYAYASLGERMIEYDTQTGNRANFSEPGVRGQGAPILGQKSMWYDAGRGLIMTAGSPNPYTLVAVDPTNGDRQDVLRDINQAQSLIPGVYPTGQGQNLKGALDNGNVTQWGAVVPSPTNPDIVYFVLLRGALVKYEISTGNSYVLSL